MAITTQAAALAGLRIPVAFSKAVSGTAFAGGPISYYPIAGFPLVGLYPNTGLTGGTYSSSSGTPQGFLPHTDPLTGNAYLAQLRASVAQPCTLLLCDRLWDARPANTTTTAQTITSPTLPARDSLGQTNGLGVQVGIEFVVAGSATAATMAMSYTNSAGVAGSTGAFIDLPTAGIPAIGRFYRIGMAAGDLGVQSVQSVTLATNWTTGTLQLVAYRVIAQLDLALANTPNMLDVISGAFPRIYNGSCLFLMIIPTTTTTCNLSGVYVESQG